MFEKSDSDVLRQHSVSKIGSHPHRIAIDVSDLIQYWQENVRPTGIQRVQIEVVRAIIQGNIINRPVEFISYNMKLHKWTVLDSSKLYGQSEIALQSNIEMDVWLPPLREMLQSASDYDPGVGDSMINLGSSWWIPDYLYKVSQLKADYGIKYISVIHDAIPLMTPQYCSQDLVLEFLLWFRQAIRIADRIIVSSNHSKQDIYQLAMINKNSCPEIQVCTLNARFSQPSHQKSHILKELGIYKRKFVLCVGTLEIRKNHLLLLKVWSRMLETLPEKDVPYLVLVGKQGWKFDMSQAYLSSSPELAGKVIIASNISDSALSTLYQECNFTVYPSFYEGWGLPLTEAASYGKLTVCSNTSSIPQAASPGDILLDPTDENAWYEKIRELSLNADMLSQAQAYSAAETRFRTWSKIASTICSAADGIESVESSPSNALVSDGIIYDFTITTAKTNISCSAMALRHGEGWHQLEHWGTWSAPGLTELSFNVSDLQRRFIYLALRGGRQVKTLKIWMNDNLVIQRTMAPDNDVLFRLDLDNINPGKQVIRFIVDKHCNFATITNDADPRKVGIGFVKFSCMKIDDLFARQNFIESLQMHFG